MAAEKTTRIRAQESNIEKLRQELAKIELENQKMKEMHLRTET